MADIAKRLSATDAAAVTAWLATQSVPNKTAIVKTVHAPANTRCGSAPELHGAVK
jgi:hypothetical protein